MRGLPCFVLAAAALRLLAPDVARAQVNSDVGLSVGAARRFTTGAEAGEPGFGPAFGLQGHLALFPMVRIGLYGAADISPMSGYGTRQFYVGGLHLKLTPPLLSGAWKLYVFTGFGAGYAHQSSYPGPGATPGATATYSDTSGLIFEVPAGLGVSYRVRAPWEVFVEFAGRFGVAFEGQLYDQGNPASVANGAGLSGPFLGQDTVALTLSAGVSWSD